MKFTFEESMNLLFEYCNLNNKVTPPSICYKGLNVSS